MKGRSDVTMMNFWRSSKTCMSTTSSLPVLLEPPPPQYASADTAFLESAGVPYHDRPKTGNERASILEGGGIFGAIFTTS